MAHHHTDPNKPGHPSEPAHLRGDELDIYPAGAGDSHHHHGHVIVPPATLIGVLVALLLLTLLTVGTSRLEMVLMDSFNFIIPQWVNVAVALSIAAVKTTLVVMFFMQLRYDNPLNSLIFIFTLITVVFFLGFTMTDLGGRNSLNRYKAQHITPGGMGLDLTGTPITESARTLASNPEHPLHKTWLKAEAAKDYSRPNIGFPIPEGVFTGSSGWQSRPVTGLTLPGFAPAAPVDDHGDTPAPAPAPAPTPQDPPDDAQSTGG